VHPQLLQTQDRRKQFLKAVKKYEKLKPHLTEFERYSIEFELDLAKFEINHPGVKYHIEGGDTIYENGKSIHVPRRIVKGPLKSPSCKLCQKDLEKMRRENPRFRGLYYCSRKCRNEHIKRKKLYEKMNKMGFVRGLIWEHPKDEKGKPLPLDRKKIFFQHGPEFEKRHIIAKKSKWHN